jgi:hypothetical protein
MKNAQKAINSVVFSKRNYFVSFLTRNEKVAEAFLNQIRNGNHKSEIEYGIIEACQRLFDP